MKTYRWLEHRQGSFGALILLAALGSSNVAAAEPARCEMQLTVDLSPDVLNPGDAEFLNSLLDDHVSYQLTLRQPPNSTVVLLNLTGPGTAERCEDVVETMRKDARVLSVHPENPYLTGLGDDDEVEGVAVEAAPLFSEEPSPTRISGNGVGSLYWAFQHPDQAWRVSLPIHEGDASGASANVKAKCVISPGPLFPDPPNADQC